MYRDNFYWPILGVLPSVQSNNACLVGSVKFSIGQKGRAAYVAAEMRDGASGCRLWKSAIRLLAPTASFAEIPRSSAAP